jgi:hypothetical protein
MPFGIDSSLGNSTVRLRSEFDDSHRNWSSVPKMNRASHWVSGRVAFCASYSGHAYQRNDRSMIEGQTLTA